MKRLFRNSYKAFYKVEDALLELNFDMLVRPMLNRTVVIFKGRNEGFGPAIEGTMKLKWNGNVELNGVE